jgi:heptosyltransferase-3
MNRAEIKKNMSRELKLPDRPKILVITLRRLGDVLLTTPLVRTLRKGFPDASIDMLVFSGTEGMLAGNPDIAQVLTISRNPSLGEALRMLPRLWRSYDLAVSTQVNDRPVLCSVFAGSDQISLVPAQGIGRWWKQALLRRSIPHQSETHRVVELLGLGAALGLPLCAEVVCPTAPTTMASLPAGRYAVLHPKPMFQYRRWTDAGWKALASALAERGLRVVITGGNDIDEKCYLDRLWDGIPVTRLDARLTWPDLTALLRGAAVYVGPDTSVTHLAAAAGCPTVALYGPASPHRIGPWPVGGCEPAWAARGTIQRRGNVWLLQNPLPCLPCAQLGCENHVLSHSRCLDELGIGQVLTAVDQALASAAELGGAFSGAQPQRPVLSAAG